MSITRYFKNSKNSSFNVRLEINMPVDENLLMYHLEKMATLLGVGGQLHVFMHPEAGFGECYSKRARSISLTGFNESRDRLYVLAHEFFHHFQNTSGMWTESNGVITYNGISYPSYTIAAVKASKGTLPAYVNDPIEKEANEFADYYCTSIGY